jgi:hypothetical protein
VPGERQFEIAEVHGDLETASRVAVLAPGQDMTLETFVFYTQAAENMMAESTRPDVAVVSWCYRTPRTPAESLGRGMVRSAASGLRLLKASLDAEVAPDAVTTLVAHSFASRVTRYFLDLPGRAFDNIVLAGPAGWGFGRPDTTSRVYEMYGPTDGVSHLRPLGGHLTRRGAAQRLRSGGSGAHNGYFGVFTDRFRGDREALRNIVRVWTGEGAPTLVGRELPWGRDPRASRLRAVLLPTMRTAAAREAGAWKWVQRSQPPVEFTDRGRSHPAAAGRSDAAAPLPEFDGSGGRLRDGQLTGWLARELAAIRAANPGLTITVDDEAAPRVLTVVGPLGRRIELPVVQGRLKDAVGRVLPVRQADGTTRPGLMVSDQISYNGPKLGRTIGRTIVHDLREHLVPAMRPHGRADRLPMDPASYTGHHHGRLAEVDYLGVKLAGVRGRGERAEVVAEYAPLLRAVGFTSDDAGRARFAAAAPLLTDAGRAGVAEVWRRVRVADHAHPTDRLVPRDHPAASARRATIQDAVAGALDGGYAGLPGTVRWVRPDPDRVRFQLVVTRGTGAGSPQAADVTVDLWREGRQVFGQVESFHVDEVGRKAGVDAAVLHRLREVLGDWGVPELRFQAGGGVPVELWLAADGDFRDRAAARQGLDALERERDKLLGRWMDRKRWLRSKADPDGELREEVRRMYRELVDTNQLLGTALTRVLGGERRFGRDGFNLAREIAAVGDHGLATLRGSWAGAIRTASPDGLELVTPEVRRVLGDDARWHHHRAGLTFVAGGDGSTRPAERDAGGPDAVTLDLGAAVAVGGRDGAVLVAGVAVPERALARVAAARLRPLLAGRAGPVVVLGSGSVALLRLLADRLGRPVEGGGTGDGGWWRAEPGADDLIRMSAPGGPGTVGVER